MGFLLLVGEVEVGLIIVDCGKKRKLFEDSKKVRRLGNNFARINRRVE